MAAIIVQSNDKLGVFGAAPKRFSSWNLAVAIIFTAILLGAAPAKGQSTSFVFTNFSDVSSIAFRGQAHQAYNSVMALTSEAPGSCGKALLAVPLQLVQISNGVCSGVSFSTSFAFRVHGYGRQCLADGLTMLITPQLELPAAGCAGGAGLGYEGEPANSMSIEFDVSKNGDHGDVDGNHVGLNVGGSTVSTMVQSLEGMIMLTDMSLKRVWIDYDAQLMLLQVRASYNQDKPEAPLLQKSIDMCQVLGSAGQVPFYVGFSASTGICFGRHDIVSWSWTHAGSLLAYANSLSSDARAFAAIPTTFILSLLMAALHFQNRH